MDKPFPDILYRQMTIDDLDELVEIDQLCFDRPRTPADFIKYMVRRGVDTMTVGAIIDDHLCGYIEFVSERKVVEINRLAVHPSCWNRGIGTQLIEFTLITQPGRRCEMRFLVDGRDLFAMNYLKHNRFKATMCCGDSIVFSKLWRLKKCLTSRS